MHRSFIMSVAVLVTLLSAPLLQATEVASITACKPDAEVWVCATWKDNQTAVYRSEHYISGVEFSGAVELGSVSQSALPVVAVDSKPRSANGGYTLQLLACNGSSCLQRLQQLKQIPDSREVEIKQNNALWQLLLVGQYRSIKTAQQAAARLMTQYRLRDKPWVRTLDSVTRRQLKP